MIRSRSVRRRAVLATGAAARAFAPAILRAQSYPSKPVRVVNAYSPGGTADVVCRIFCAALSTRLGQNLHGRQQAGRGRHGRGANRRPRAAMTVTPCSTMPPRIR